MKKGRKTSNFLPGIICVVLILGIAVIIGKMVTGSKNDQNNTVISPTPYCITATPTVKPTSTPTPTPTPSPSPSPTPTPAMFDNNFVAHALGGIEECTYLSSKEGFELSLEKNMLFIEVDLYFSSDDKLICTHGFKKNDIERMGNTLFSVGNIPTFAEWNEALLQDKFHTTNGYDILKYLLDYPELYFEFDMRELYGENATHMAEKVLEVYGEEKDIFNRILIQVYSIEMFQKFKEVYDFPVMQFYMKKAYLPEIDTYIEFCQNNGIKSIAISDTYITDEILEKLLNSGLKIMVHTVDDIDKAKEYLDKGVNIICTNFLYCDESGNIASKLSGVDENYADYITSDSEEENIEIKE